MKLKLIQVGLGGMGTFIAQDFIIPSPDYEYAGLVEMNSERLEYVSNVLKVAQTNCYTDYEEAFQQLEADAVFVSAFSPAHYEICKAALENNLHVLVEKPFVLKIEEAKELVELASSRKLKLMVNQNYRFFHSVLTLKKTITDKVVGDPTFVQTEFFFDHNGRPYQREMEDYMLLEMAVHHIDMMRFLFDSNISSVNGKTWNEPESGYIGDPNVQATYELESGLPIFYLGSLISKGKITPWEGVWRVQCEQGSIHLDDLGDGYGVYVVDANQHKTKVNVEFESPDGIHGSLAHFAKAIREDFQPITSGVDNLKTLAALFATSASSKEQRGISPIAIVSY